MSKPVLRWKLVDYKEVGMERSGTGDWCQYADVQRMAREHAEMEARLRELEEVHRTVRGQLVWSGSGTPVAPKVRKR